MGILVEIKEIELNKQIKIKIMNLERLDLEKYEVLELERDRTLADPLYQQWVSELGVSSSYSDRGGIIRANELNRQYEYSTLGKI